MAAKPTAALAPGRSGLAALLLLVSLGGPAPLRAAAAPPLQTFRMAEVDLIGCRGVAMPRTARGSRPAEVPLLAAWSLERGWGVMRINGRLQRFNLGKASREKGAAALKGLPPRWQLPWSVGGHKVELRFPSQPLGPKRWGGDGMLRITTETTGDVHALAIWVEERC